MKKLSLYLIMGYLFVFLLSAETNNQLSISLLPGANNSLTDSNEMPDIGGKVQLELGFLSGLFPRISVNGETGFTYMPISPLDSVSLYNLGIGVGFRMMPEKRLSLDINTALGFYYGIINDDDKNSAGNFYSRTGVSASFNFTSQFGLRLQADYTYTHLFDSNFTFSVGPRLFFPLGKNKEAAYNPDFQLLRDIKFFDVFPVLFKYYDDHPVGSAIIENNSSLKFSDINVSLYVEKYMTDPKICILGEVLEPGESLNIDLFALFDNSVLEITEGTKVSSKIIVDYFVNGQAFQEETVQTLSLFDRNALTWDDDRKAAAFITAKDPNILEYAKNVSSWISGEYKVNNNLSLVIAVHEALGESGISYSIDPSSSFFELSQNTKAVDFIQFPRQTLTYSAGDCDDLSILYCSLLEAQGVATAFVTVPGHIFMAVSLKMNLEEALQIFPNSEDLIIIKDEVWLPLEITMVGKSFFAAWREGAKQWREYESTGQAVFLPTIESWKLYAPVGFPGQASDINLPVKENVIKNYNKEYQLIVNYMISNKVDDLKQQMSNSNNNPRYINRLGVLYARYGLNNKAVETFKDIIERNEYVPALVNMGNIKFIAGDMSAALELYKRADVKDPENAQIILGIARIEHGMENYTEAKEIYTKLVSLDSKLADRFAYLGGAGSSTSRASSAVENEGVVIWNID